MKKFIFLQIIILFILIDSQYSTCRTNVDQYNLRPDNEILLLYDKLMFHDIVSFYNNAVDINKLSPYYLNILCSALKEAKYDVRKFLYKKNADTHIIEYALAFTDLIEGRAESAEIKFHKLKDSLGDGQYFGTIGLFEHAIFTLNHSELKNQIQKEQNSTLNNINEFNKLIRYYSILYNRLTGNMSNVVEILKNINDEDIEEDFELSIIRIETKIFQNNIDEALISINNIIDKFGPIQEAILMKYKLINIKYGNEKGIDFLQKEIAKDNNLWQIKLIKYYHDLESNEINTRNIAMKNIITIANNRANDIPSFLSICNDLIDYGYYTESGNLINTFLKKTDNQSKFFMSNFFMSKFFYMTNKRSDFKSSYNTAMLQSENDPNFLWFQYNIAINSHNNDEALKILDKLLSFDPFDIFAIYEKIAIYVNMNDRNNAVLYAKKIYDSRRFIEIPVKNKIKTLLKKLSFNLN